MPISHQDFQENTLHKFNRIEGYTQKGNEISFWAFLLSIFVYISIFYIFNLSPVSVLNNTKFWFFISNTLILIIAADFGAFSLSKKQEDPYDDYLKTTTKNNLEMVRSQNLEIVSTTYPLVKVENLREIPEVIKKVVHVDGFEIKPEENNLQITLKNDFRKLSTTYLEDVPRFTQQVDNDFKSCGKIVCTMSGLSSPAKGLEDKAMIKCQNEYEKYEKAEEGDGKESEFSKMSNEELNRRVEEFIRRSNRQIRLQAPQTESTNLDNP